MGSGYPVPVLVEREPQGVPSSWGTSLCLRRVLRPRRDRRHQAMRCADAAPVRLKTKARRGWCSRGSIARLGHSLSTLRRARYRDATQDSLPAAGQALPGGLAYPQGSYERFPRVVVTSLPPFPSLLGAITVHGSRVTCVHRETESRTPEAGLRRRISRRQGRRSETAGPGGQPMEFGHRVLSRTSACAHVD